MKNIVVIGGGGHAKVVISLIKKKLAEYSTIGFTDPEQTGELLGVPYLGSDSELKTVLHDYSPCSAVLGIGKTEVSSKRLKIAARLLEMGFDLPPLISPSAVINEGVSIGDGSVIFDGAVINSGAVIGECCIMNTNSTVEHDCRLANNVHIAPGATLSGSVTLADNCMVGTGANIIQGIHITAGCMIGAGATVVSDLVEPGIYVGVPARKIR